MDYALGNIITQSELPSSRGLGHIPFTDATGVQIPLGVPFKQKKRAVLRLFFVASVLSGYTGKQVQN